MSKLQKRAHCELIKAWADGYEIEFLSPCGKLWLEANPLVWSVNVKYRIKDEYTHLREAIKAGHNVYYVKKLLNGGTVKELSLANKNYEKGLGNIETAFLNLSNDASNYVIEEVAKVKPFDSIEDLKIVLGRTVKSADSIGVITGGFLGVNGERTKNIMYFYTGDSSHPITAEDLLRVYTFADESPCGKLVK